MLVAAAKTGSVSSWFKLDTMMLTIRANQIEILFISVIFIMGFLRGSFSIALFLGMASIMTWAD